MDIYIIYIYNGYVFIYTMVDYYSVIKKNERVPFVATWIDLEIITLSKSERER